MAISERCRPLLPEFSHLTKTLSCNLYDLGYAATPAQQDSYAAYIGATYNAGRLTGILREVAERIGAKILNIAHHDYERQGASVTLLLADETPAPEPCAVPPGGLPEALVCHLDKSHLTVHTYPENRPGPGVSAFRAELDISTCGRISPLTVLNDLIDGFAPDLAVLDYRVRGFSRDANGRKHFMDHPIRSIQDFLREDIRERYRMRDVNVGQEQIFYTKMILKEFALNDYLFGVGGPDMSAQQRIDIEQRVRREMAEIFYAGNPPEEPPF